MGEKMAELEKKLKLKQRGKELKRLARKGAEVLGSSCRKGWKKLRKLAKKINMPSS
ncbi:hypothetical protein AXF42_Ash009946 [Apostasia shenzhenica]|uniref:Uncharacterized protein n=1 Tax=Apostasia shenzhenica TaxID=1088818 RepID=A0A2I0ACG9_9ASPA|nr:hypothetical protein AXF42_Ash009946 [Apostasia shenzhenica]